MNLTTKKPIIIIAALLAGAAFLASCSKAPEAQAEKSGKKAPAAAKAKSIPADENNILNAVRNGQFVHLDWRVAGDARKFKQIEIGRSPTGKKLQQTKVAVLKPDATSYQDRLPNERATWYTVKVVMLDGNFQEIGPVRVDADKAGAANYINQGNEYAASATRTDDFTMLTWDFPQDACAEVRIIRATRPIAQPFRKPRYTTDVVTSKEGKSQYSDTLSDPNADYWYWFRVTLKSGTIVDKGPIKAEYAKRQTK